VVGHELADAGVEIASDFGDEAAVALDIGHFALVFDLERENAIWSIAGHEEFLIYLRTNGIRCCFLGKRGLLRGDSLILWGGMGMKS
jgi:hypothetical protein